MIEPFPPVIEPEEAFQESTGIPAMMDALNTLSGVTARELFMATDPMPPAEMDLAYSSALSALNFVTNIVVFLRQQREAAEAAPYDMLQVMIDSEMACVACSTGVILSGYPEQWDIYLTTDGDYHIFHRKCTHQG